MNKLSVEDIIKILTEDDVSVSDFAYGDFGDYKDKIEYNGHTYQNYPRIGAWKEVDHEGGEGQGDHWHSVKYFPQHDVYIMTVGWYTSHYGTDFESGYGDEVIPKEKTITVYETINTKRNS